MSAFPPSSLLQAFSWLTGSPDRAGTEGDRADRLAKQVKDLPVPVFWLLGKTQSGKSSIVREITGVPKIEIGQGYKACTKSSALYAFPNEQSPLLYFLDTRGLFEAGYDASEDIAFCENQAHLVMVVVRIGDHALEPLIQTLRQVASRHREWPMLVVQTCLHEAYPRGAAHPQPYPFGEALPEEAPLELRHHLRRQRELFAEFSPRFVAVDFTQPDDGFEPQDYGRDALLAAINDLLPEVNRNILGQLQSGQHGDPLRAAQPYLMSYSLLAGSVAALPVPFLDVPGVAAIELKLLHTIAKIYGQKLTIPRTVEIISVVGTGFAARMAGREIMKVVPGGSIGTAVFTAASTYALGSVFCAYFTFIREGKRPDRAALKRILSEQLELGQRLFSEWTHGQGQKGN